MKTIIAAILLLPLLAKAQTTIKPQKCNYEINGIDAFTGKVKKTSQWVNITSESQPIIQMQLIREDDNYFINLALSPQQFNLNTQQGYSKTDPSVGNVFQVKLDNGEILSFNMITQHTLNSTVIVASYSVNYYSAVYSISKEQLEQLASNSILKARVYHDNGCYFDLTTISTTSSDQIKSNALCMLQ